MSGLWHISSLPWQACIEQAWQAYCAGSVPIGACITDGDATVLAVGRNRMNEHVTTPQPFLCGNRLAHAEVNALLGLDESVVDAHTCVLYTTTEPCPLCVGALTMANIRCFRYASRDPWAGAADLVGLQHYIVHKQIRAIGPQDTRLEAVLVAINTESHLRRTGGEFPAFLQAWEADLPVGVRFGKRLFADGTLQRMQQQGLSAMAMIDELAARLEVNP
jgi:tRNA(adenine34) deaminase